MTAHRCQRACPQCLTKRYSMTVLRDCTTTTPDGRDVLVRWGTCDTCGRYGRDLIVDDPPVASPAPRAVTDVVAEGRLL